jgi:hypothetical protein
MRSIIGIIFFIFSFLYVVATFQSCKKDPLIIIHPKAPLLYATNVTDITNNSAISGGSIINDRGSAITIRGVCWSTSTNPVTTFIKTLEQC